MRDYRFIIFMLSASIFTSCSDCITKEMHQEQSTAGSRALYDDSYVEWDNTYYLSYKLGNDNLITNVLPVPWASGNSQAIGIPQDWFDRNITNPDATQRMYSHVNGWTLVYSNLLEPGLRNKYFALYNKYTGKLRIFFYAMEATSGYGTSTTFAGIQVTGSSFLNFTYSDPKAMDYRPSCATYVFAPNCDFGQALASTEIQDKYPIPGVSYKSNNWYGLELECAYDEAPSTSSNVGIKLWAANIVITKAEGESVGNIIGNVSTTYSNTPSFDLALSFSNSNSSSTSVTRSINNNSLILGDKIAEGVNEGIPFFTGIWNKIKIEAPSIASQGIKAGVNALCTGGASLLTNVAGKLFNSVLGFGKEKTMTSLSEVKLKSNADLSLDATSTSVIAGWGEIKDLPLPGCGNTSKLYNEKLGVWNIPSTPTVQVDLYSTAYFYPTTSGIDIMSIDPQKIPQEWETEYQISLSPFDIKLNPIVLNDFTIQNIHKDLITTSELENLTCEISPYGLYNDLELYQSSSNILSVKEIMPPIKLNRYNPNTSYNETWENEVEILNKCLYCRVSFELKNKTTSEIIGFSKYFKAKAVKGNHSHRDIRDIKP